MRFPIFTIMLVIWTLATTWAITASGAWGAELSCKTPFEKTFYTATFPAMTTEVSTKDVGAENTMSVAIGSFPQGPKSKAGAGSSDSKYFVKIAQNGSCQVVCQIKSFEKESPLSPVAMDLECRSDTFSPLTVSATIMWPRNPIRSAVLRFGTWSHGYTDVPLLVQYDGYSDPAFRPERMLAAPARLATAKVAETP